MASKTPWRTRIALWWLERVEIPRAQKRMVGCAHTETLIVDVGIPVQKCRRCWALYLGRQWNANTVSPADSVEWSGGIDG